MVKSLASAHKTVFHFLIGTGQPITEEEAEALTSRKYRPLKEGSSSVDNFESITVCVPSEKHPSNANFVFASVTWGYGDEGYDNKQSLQDAEALASQKAYRILLEVLNPLRSQE